MPEGADVNAMTNKEYKVFENRVRRMAARQKLTLTKSRRRDPRAYDYCKYRLVNERGTVAVGHDTGLSLDEIERALREG